MDQNSATEEVGAVPTRPAGAQPAAKERSFLAAAKRSLSEDELAAPGVRRFLIDEMERLEARCSELQIVADSYHDLRVEKAVLESKIRTSRWHEVLSGLCLAMGSAGVGLSTRLLGVQDVSDIGLAFLTASSLLVIAGIASKVWR